MEEKDDLEITDAKDLEGEEDKTSEKNEEETEDESKDKDEDKDKSSAIAQKKHWRDKYNSLKEELEELKKVPKEEKSTDEAEKKAEQYIDDRIEKILEKKAVLKVREEEKAVEEFSEQIDEVLEENPDITEKEILDVTEQFLKEKLPITPKQAIRFIKLSKETKKEKPKMPSPNRGSSETKKEEETPSGEKGNFWNVTEKLLKNYGLNNSKLLV